MNHYFTLKIKKILNQSFKKEGTRIFEQSQLLQYINIKTKSANKGSKARSNFANLYAIYVIIEDYLNHSFDKKRHYSKYEGAEFINLFNRQRKLPFGSKLQNHALNHRMNSEFQKFFPNSEYTPILRNLETNRYWINENLIKIKVENKTYNIAHVILKIIDQYVQTKKDSLEQLIQSCLILQKIKSKKLNKIEEFIVNLLQPNTDARLFEIVSYAILKYYFNDQIIYWGFSKNTIKKDNLMLYKTGRTNANDGGIDFVMKPLGRFFQVTETLDVKKYFLDIDKIQRYPITFVVKSQKSSHKILQLIEDNALRIYSIKQMVDKYMESIEEIINIDTLHICFKKAVRKGYTYDILDEIIKQSKVEFNYQDKLE